MDIAAVPRGIDGMEAGFFGDMYENCYQLCAC